MSAQTVWNRIISYNLAAAIKIKDKFGSGKSVIAALEHYPDKGKYHGHASGSGGDGENKGGSDMRQKAIDFLADYDLTAKTAAPKKSGNPNAKSDNKSFTAELMAILNSHKANLGNAKVALSLYSSTWEQNRDVKNNYDNLVREKRELHANKTKNNKSKKTDSKLELTV